VARARRTSKLWFGDAAERLAAYARTSLIGVHGAHFIGRIYPCKGYPGSSPLGFALEYLLLSLMQLQAPLTQALSSGIWLERSLMRSSFLRYYAGEVPDIMAPRFEEPAKLEEIWDFIKLQHTNP
jgi:hypothetical protein